MAQVYNMKPHNIIIHMISKTISSFLGLSIAYTAKYQIHMDGFAK